MRALPPQHVYSAAVKNSLPSKADFVFTFTHADGSTEEERVSLDPSAEHKTAERTRAAGSMTTIAHISKVVVTSDAGTFTQNAPFPDVNSPVRGYPLEMALVDQRLVIKK